MDSKLPTPTAGHLRIILCMVSSRVSYRIFSLEGEMTMGELLMGGGGHYAIKQIMS